VWVRLGEVGATSPPQDDDPHHTPLDDRTADDYLADLEASMSSKGPRNGPAHALLKADPDANVAEVLAGVPRWECQGCGRQRFAWAVCCGECGAEEIEKVPGPGGSP
jgi:hypothetical protein